MPAAPAACAHIASPSRARGRTRERAGDDDALQARPRCCGSGEHVARAAHSGVHQLRLRVGRVDEEGVGDVEHEVRARARGVEAALAQEVRLDELDRSRQRGRQTQQVVHPLRVARVAHRGAHRPAALQQLLRQLRAEVACGACDDRDVRHGAAAGAGGGVRSVRPQALPRGPRTRRASHTPKKGALLAATCPHARVVPRRRRVEEGGHALVDSWLTGARAGGGQLAHSPFPLSSRPCWCTRVLAHVRFAIGGAHARTARRQRHRQRTPLPTTTTSTCVLRSHGVQRPRAVRAR